MMTIQVLVTGSLMRKNGMYTERAGRENSGVWYAVWSLVRARVDLRGQRSVSRASRLGSCNQLVLDLSREDVQDYMIGRMTAIFEETPITYVKWDFNRSICDKFSAALNAQSQGDSHTDMCWDYIGCWRHW